jgi:nitrite reductase (NADH) large subunit
MTRSRALSMSAVTLTFKKTAPIQSSQECGVASPQVVSCAALQTSSTNTTSERSKSLMPSGHAYAKALRTVKTCVGSEWCRFGTQDSTKMGVDLEQALWRMYAPHKVKLAVSGCPRNCAESGIKDVGVIGVDSGWELYIGGNAGIKTEVAQFFVKVKTSDEVLEYSGAFLQLYREEGWYLERTVHYLGRVGMDYIKARVLEDVQGRQQLWERLQFALDGEPDPWVNMQKARVDERQFTPLSIPEASGV